VKLGGRRPPLLPDAELIRTLAQLLHETGLSEIEYAVGDRRVRVARTLALAPASAPAASSAEVAVVVKGNSASEAVVEHTAVTAPMVGTAYLAAQPGMPPFAQLGDSVDAGQPLLIIEAMKVMNQIRSPRSGRIAGVLVEDGQPVEFGQPLMLIE
jgi:acetyl-CoA carboxylase biotin carboxyl carrier protein